jgi:hypothetical protein
MSFPVFVFSEEEQKKTRSKRQAASLDEHFPDTHRAEEKYIIKSQRRSPESEHKNLYSSKYIASATFSLVTTMPMGVHRNDKKNIFTLSLCASANTFSFLSWSHLEIK